MTQRIKKESLKGTSVNKIILPMFSCATFIFPKYIQKFSKRIGPSPRTNNDTEAEFDSHLYILLILYREAFWKIVQLNSMMRHA